MSAASTGTGFVGFGSRVVSLPLDDIDTDQIIPARFLTTTTKTDLARTLFADWRTGADGKVRADFPLDTPAALGAEVLVAGRNFGCGSSREHAVWALASSGFRAIVALSFADIFRANALKNGLLPIQIDRDFHTELLRAAALDASMVVTVDLEAQSLRLPGGTAATFPIDPFAKRCLLRGVDELGLLLSYLPLIEAHEAARG
jgi:3-isopropylmalate/(R)-2-methylmalate dehydratase small subunit